MCVKEKVCVCVRERVSVCVCVCERERVCVFGVTVCFPVAGADEPHGWTCSGSHDSSL